MRFSFAAVYPKITKDDLFFETVAVNRGLRVCAFDKLAEAIEWLKQERVVPKESPADDSEIHAEGEASEKPEE
jgi:hypothetical protein